jgi:23S rRNA (pseudouridine1915-N3)-methyltransferase
VIAVGRAGHSPEAALFDRYAARLRPRLALIEIADAKGSAAEIRRREGERILAAVPDGALLVALDLGGIAPDSDGLVTLLGRWRDDGRAPAFAIGGAEGLDQAVLDASDMRLALSRLTLPHLLARVLLAEALFRAQSIAAGHPYHRAWRPVPCTARAPRRK